MPTINGIFSACGELNTLFLTTELFCVKIQ